MIRFSLSILFLLVSIVVSAQEEILMTLGGKPVTRSEFERIYHKNSSLPGIQDNKGVQEYVDLFVNFKLKVLEAENLGLDTLTSFLTELTGYRDQLARSYMKDTTFDEIIIREAYERMKTDLHVSHILVRCEADAYPKDTLAAWEKIMQIRKRLLKGEAFDKVARATSEDTYVKDNGGEIGWITAFYMPYPFENAAYSLKIGEISQAVRTPFGYHLIRLNKTRPSRGEILVAHIYKAAPANASPAEQENAKRNIDAIYDSLAQGINFADLAARNSEDHYSAMKGGELPWFGTGRMIPEFEEAAFSLTKNGSYTQPVKSSYGWHIIKRLDQRNLLPLDQLRTTIKNQMNYSKRNLVSRDLWIAKLKKDYAFAENKKALSPFYTLIDSATLASTDKWDVSTFAALQDVMFSLENKKYNQQDFVKFFTAKGKNRRSASPDAFIKEVYKEFTDDAVINYEKSQLENKYPDFRYLMQEYHDGILLFDLTDKMVWSKAVKDTVGLTSFYNANKNNYMWSERVSASIYNSKDSALLVKAIKPALKRIKKNLPASSVIDLVCANDSTKKCITIEDGLFEKGDNPTLDNYGWEPGITPIFKSNNKYQMIAKSGTLSPKPKELNEARGMVTADYQDYLEKEWIQELRKKYTVTINYDMLSKIK